MTIASTPWASMSPSPNWEPRVTDSQPLRMEDGHPYQPGPSVPHSGSLGGNSIGFGVDIQFLNFDFWGGLWGTLLAAIVFWEVLVPENIDFGFTRSSKCIVDLPTFNIYHDPNVSGVSLGIMINEATDLSAANVFLSWLLRLHPWLVNFPSNKLTRPMFLVKLYPQIIPRSRIHNGIICPWNHVRLGSHPQDP